MIQKFNPEDIKTIYFDLFAGAGGTSTGVVKARIDERHCSLVAACINHDSNAIRSHRSNHKQTLHFTEDITELYKTSRWEKLRAHVALMRMMYPNAKIILWASLECTNFSKAKGGLPRDADSRTLAEHLFPYIEMIRPDYIHIENVEEFMSWGEIDSHGKPISKFSGKDYIRWTNTVRDYGYSYDHRILNSADFGGYTSRRRLFIQFARPELPIVWPEPTHCKGGSKGMFAFSQWKPVRDVLDLDDEGKSIFNRPKPLVDASHERIYAGLIKFVAGGKDKWILKYNSVDGKSGKHNPPGIDEPCPVVSCQNRLGLVQTKFMQGYYGNGDNLSSIDNPCPTVTTKDRHALVTTEFIVNQYSGGGQLSDIDKPCPTILNTPKQNIVTCRQWIMNTNFNNIGSSLDQPAQTITANRKWHYLMNPQYKSAGSSLDNPCFTLIARMDKAPAYLIEANTEGEFAPFIRHQGNTLIYEIYANDSEIMVKIKEFMALYGIIDIKMRMLNIPELKMIMGFPKDYILIGTQAEQKKFIGNAVEVNMSRVLCETTAKAVMRYNLKIAG